MAQTLLVEILGNAAGLKASLAESGVASEGLGSKLGSLAKTAALALGAAALGGLALVLDKSVKAAMADEAATTRLDTALKNTGQSVKAMSPILDAAEQGAAKFGFSATDAKTALGGLETATGSTKKSISDLGIAEDVARFKHTDLASASQMLSMAMAGSTKAAHALGIQVSAVTTNYDKLKLSGANLKTETGILEEAHAKLLDKMATGNAVIQAVSERVKGQAQAYSDTAAGGMAQFGAMIDNLEVKLGNILMPILVQVMQWVQANWPTISAVFNTVFGVIGDLVQAVKPVFVFFEGLIADAVTYVQDNWTQISGVFNTVFSDVKDIVNSFISIVEAVWNQFGSAILQVAQNNLQGIEQVIKDVFGVIEGIFDLIKDVLTGKWGAAWDALKQIVGDSLDAIWTVIKTAVVDAGIYALALGKAILDGVLKGLSALAGLLGKALGVIGETITSVAISAADWALQLGKDLVNGILNGLGGLASALINMLKGAIGSAISSVGHFFGIGSPSKVTAEKLGKPLAQGVTVGWSSAAAGLVGTMNMSLNGAVAGVASAPSAAGAARSGGNNYTINSYSLDPSTAGTHVINAIRLFENANGPQFQRV